MIRHLFDQILKYGGYLEISYRENNLWHRGGNLYFESSTDALSYLKDKQYEFFYGVNPRNKKRERGRGGYNRDCTISTIIWADIDGYIEDIDIKCSYKVKTGGGYHLLWFLKEKQRASDSSLWMRKLLYPIINIQLKGTYVDEKCGNPARLLRLPGFKNPKYNKTVTYTGHGDLYTLDDILNILKVSEGSRNSFLFDIRRKHGSDINDINNKICSPPLPKNEVEGIIKSVKRITPIQIAEEIMDVYNIKLSVNDDTIVYYDNSCNYWVPIQSWRQIDAYIIETYKVQPHKLRDIHTAIETGLGRTIYKDTKMRIAVKNGRIEFDNGGFEFIEGSNENIYINKGLDVIYKEDAIAPSYMSFIRSISEKKEDIIQALHCVSCKSIIPKTDQQIYVIIGPPGTGKSTLIHVWDILTKSMSISLPFSRISMDSFDLGLLQHKTVCYCGELPTRAPRIMNAIKAITGGDMISARRKYMSTIVFKPTVTLIATCNSIPVNITTDSGIRDRLRIIPLHNRFRSTEQEIAHDNIIESIKKEASGMLNIFLSNYKSDFVMPTTGTDYLDAAINRDTGLNEWIDTEIVIHSNGWCSSGELIESWRKYSGIYNPKIGHILKEYVDNMYPQRKRINTKVVRGWAGISIKRR